MAGIAIPGAAHDITSSWLTSVLRSSGVIKRAEVTDCQTSAIGEGIGLVGQLLRVQIHYDVGDFRLDNQFFLDAESRIAVIDWSGYRSGPGVWDVSHFICQGLDPEIRVSCERELVQIYHQTLVENGVRDYSLDQVWYDYRLSMLIHLQKLIRGFASFDIVNDRHQRVTQVIRRHVSSAVVDHYGDDLVNP